MNNIYVDNSSTTKLNSYVLLKMLPYLKENYGNASTSYSLGKEARCAIDTSRKNIAKILNVDSDDIYFTSSGTEADNMALRGIAYKYREKGNHIITSKIEHLAVLNTCKELEKEGFEVTYLDVGEDGIIKAEDVKNAIKDTTILISIMYVNNEIGTIQNVHEISKIAKQRDIVFHTDAVQAMPHLAIDATQFDAMSISAHKFNGPKGVGMLYVNKKIQIQPIIFGGHQEKCLRPGTENVAGIVGMSEALKLTNYNLEQKNKKEKKLRDYLLKKLNDNISGLKINGSMNQRIDSNLNISIDGINANDVLIFLDMNGICASTGSACNSNIKEVSHVLKAIGQTNVSLRITLSYENTFEEMNKIVYVLKDSVETIRNKKD